MYELNAFIDQMGVFFKLIDQQLNAVSVLWSSMVSAGFLWTIWGKRELILNFNTFVYRRCFHIAITWHLLNDGIIHWLGSMIGSSGTYTICQMKRTLQRSILPIWRRYHLWKSSSIMCHWQWWIHIAQLHHRDHPCQVIRIATFRIRVTPMGKPISHIFCSSNFSRYHFDWWRSYQSTQTITAGDKSISGWCRAWSHLF